MKRVGKALLLFNLQILLLAPNCMQQKMDRGFKSTDQYWAETGLGSTELETLLEDANCRLDESSFLACVNAVGQMAERYNQAVLFDGTLRMMTTEDVENRLSEKKELARWSPKFDDLREKISFLQIWKELDTKFVRPTERSTIVAVGINGFLSLFKDPHTYIMPLAMYEEVVANSEARNASAGMIARRVEGELIVRKVYEGSSADKAGIKKGDHIVAINGQMVSTLAASKISDVLKMRGMERANISVVRKDQNMNFEMFRSEAIFPSVASKLIESSHRAGLITIHKFAKDVCVAVRQKLIDFKQEGVQGILLDLRDNPGGQVEEAACIANLFLDKGTFLFETRYLDASKPSDRYIAENDKIYNGPLAILINSGSASASEIVAGALRDQGRAKLVGERSFGKGSFQDGRVWGANSKIALFETEGFYYFPSGWTPQLVGLQPDVQVNFNLSDGLREEESFMNPLVPVDSWSGPQSLSWLTERECDLDMQDVTTFSSSFAMMADDPQLQKAQALISCGARNDRNGSL
jgi:carboxyl-terminal processing protease